MGTRQLAVMRRRWIVRGVAVGLAGLALGALRPSRAAGYPATIAAMRLARDAETRVHAHYLAYGREACREGYRGVAYLFAAVAASEQVHAGNFARLLARLGADDPPAPQPAVAVETTQKNLVRAAGGELHSIETFYPDLLERIRAEGFDEAVRVVQWAWKSEQQHRDKMQQILRWSPAFFGRVARTIDEKTGRYFVCANCGATTNAVPEERCAICGEPPSRYRAIEPPAC